MQSIESELGPSFGRHYSPTGAGFRAVCPSLVPPYRLRSELPLARHKIWSTILSMSGLKAHPRLSKTS